MSKIKIGVFSFEHMHAFSYTSALKKMATVELVGIYDADEYRGMEMASHFKSRYFKSDEELLNQKLDGIVICTNNRDHVSFVEKATKRNIPFLVEKPLTNSIENGEKILSLLENDTAGMMAFPMRFNPSILEAKKLVDSGAIGDILSITGINHGKIPSGWFLDQELSGGGAIIDHTVHIADLIRWFTNTEFKSVFAEGGAMIHNKQIDDTGIILATLKNGCQVSIDCSWAHHDNYPIWPQVDLEIIGSKGSLTVKGFALVNTQINKKTNSYENVVWSEDGDSLMIKSFVDLCAGTTQPQNPTIVDGFKALEVAVAAYKSIESTSVITL